MNRKTYIISVSVVVAVFTTVIVTNLILNYITNWLWIFIAAMLVYMYLRYRISSPLQMFSTKFNMLVDYDLDVKAAEKLAQDGVDNAPTEGIKALYMVYLGMAKYYLGEYRNAINTLNQVETKKLNPAYHILIFAFIAYSAYEEGDMDSFDLSLERMNTAKNRVNRKYVSFAAGYIEILQAIQNLDEDPEGYKAVIEKHFSRNDGYITTKLIYNYRLAYYYKTIGDTEEMDKCLAKVIANGKEHHTALQAQKMFTGTCNIDDFVFQDETVEKQGDIEEIEDPLLIESIKEEDIDIIEDITEDPFGENKEDK
jgi:tetratricopeptide (TPR) repeat protein